MNSASLEAGSRILRAAYSTWRKLLEAAFVPELGQSTSITCSRWRLWPGARAGSFRRVAAFLRRHSSPSMIRDPTETEKPPSSLMRTVSGFSPVGVLYDATSPSKPAGGHIF